MNMIPQNEFLVHELNVKMDERGFLLTMKKDAVTGDDLNTTIQVRFPAQGLLKFILVLFQAGKTYQDTFGADIGFPPMRGEEHEERTTEK